jgi:hypothetical protein
MADQKKRKAPKFKTDREDGIRNLRVIKSLPVSELTDEEICKLFLSRFEARAIVMMYVDKQGQYYSFGRLYSGKELFARYRRCVRYCWNLIHKLTSDFHHVPEWPEFKDDSPDSTGLPPEFDAHGHYIKQ